MLLEASRVPDDSKIKNQFWERKSNAKVPKQNPNTL